ncbi:MAG: hypothetical protein QOJ16_3137 [Acidobacteriota bacterium]|jgi:hypothetical protein|nr:hypothetical protein [Acidobacteriota bacterium]
MERPDEDGGRGAPGTVETAMTSPGRERQSRQEAPRTFPGGVREPAPRAGLDSWRPGSAAGEPDLLAVQRLQGNRHVQRLIGSLERAPKKAKDPAPAPLSLPEAMRRGAPIGGGKVRFYPRSLTGSRLGQADTPAGLAGDFSERLNVFIDSGTTLKALAELLLPLWNDAAESRPDPDLGEPVVPPTPLTAADLAKALLAYNANYLAVPRLTPWQAGLRLPLPVRIDLRTGEGIVNPVLVLDYVKGYQAEWEPLLGQAAGALAAADPADLEKDEKDFLATHSDAVARGIGLAARILTNPRQARPFTLDLLGRLPAAEALALTLELLDEVGRRTELLSSDPDGVTILDKLRDVLKAAPASPSPELLAKLDKARSMLDLGRKVEIELATRDWPSVLPPPVARTKRQRITKTSGKLELEVPELPAGSLTSTQQGVVDRIRANRAALPEASDKLEVKPYKGKANAGYSYLGEGSKGIHPQVPKADKKRQEVLDAIQAEMGHEGGFSAVNTYDDAIVTLGQGFTRSQLAKVMQAYFAQDPAAEDAFLDLGITWAGGRALVVNTGRGAIEEGDDALRLIQLEPKVLSIFVRQAESAEHGPKLATAQFQVVAGTAAAVPKSVVDTWTDLMAIRLVAHLIQFRSAKQWKDYEGTGGSVKEILKVAAPVIGTVDPGRGKATFLTAEQTGVVLSFAKGKAKEALDSPSAADLPADIAKVSYAGNIFFEDGKGKFFRMSP